MSAKKTQLNLGCENYRDTDKATGTANAEANAESAPKRNYLSSALTLMNSPLGVNILVMPRLFEISGVAWGTLQLFIIAILNTIGIYLMHVAAEAFELRSYFKIYRYVFHTKRRFIVHFLFLGYTLRKILCYQAFVTQCFFFIVREFLWDGKMNNPDTALFVKMAICITVNIIGLP